MHLPKPVTNRFAQAVALLAAMILGGALLVSAYGGMISPSRTAIWAVAAMVFPLVLALSLVMLILEVIWFRKAAVVTALSLLASGSAILTYCPLHLFRPSVSSIEEGKHGKAIKLMTYNMLNLDDFSKGFCRVADGNPTVSYILEENPDILLCQEGNPLLEEGSKNITPEQHRMLFERYPYRHINKRGMGILSRYSFTVVPVEHEDRWLYDVNRYDVSLGSDTMVVFNLHLQSLGLTPDDKALYHDLTNGDADKMKAVRSSLIDKLTSALRKREKQARVIRNAIDSVPGTVIVCGDFNDIPGCYAQRLIQGHDLDDAYRQAGLGPAITYHADRFFFRIDHILYRGQLKPLRVWSGDNPSSDHFPLIAFFETDL